MKERGWRRECGGEHPGEACSLGEGGLSASGGAGGAYEFSTMVA